MEFLPQELDRGPTLKSSLPSLSNCRLVIFFFFFFENFWESCYSFLHIVSFFVCNIDWKWRYWYICFFFLFCFSFFLFIARFLNRTQPPRRGRNGQWQGLSVEARAFTAITCNFHVLRLTLLAMNARTFNALVNAGNWGLLDPLSLIPWQDVVLSYLIDHPQTVSTNIILYEV